MRISDWSSDVCSSDLIGKGHARRCEPLPEHRRSGTTCRRTDLYAAFLRSAGTHLEHANQWKSASVRARCPSSHCHHQGRSEEHTSELQSLMRISYAVFCLKTKIYKQQTNQVDNIQN